MKKTLILVALLASSAAFAFNGAEPTEPTEPTVQADPLADPVPAAAEVFASDPPGFVA